KIVLSRQGARESSFAARTLTLRKASVHRCPVAGANAHELAVTMRHRETADDRRKQVRTVIGYLLRLGIVDPMPEGLARDRAATFLRIEELHDPCVAKSAVGLDL